MDVRGAVRRARAAGGSEAAIAAAIFLLVVVVSAATQPLIATNGGRGWDGASYYSVAQQIVQGERPSEEGPFVYRVGTPFLAALIAPNDLMSGFVVVNAAANGLTAALFFFWLRLFLPVPWIRVALFTAFVSTWHGPIRFFHFYPVSAEHLTYAVNMIGLIGAHALRDRISLRMLAGLSVVAALGAAIRETALLAFAALPFATQPLRFGRGLPSVSPLLLLPLGAGVLALVGVHAIATQTNEYGFLRAITVWLTEKSPFVYVLGWCNAYGPLLVLPLIAWRRSITFLWSHQTLAAFLAASAVLGWVGGQDTERYVFWSAPVVYVLIGNAIPELVASLSRPILAALAIAQSLAERVLVPVPQPAVFDPTTLERGRPFDFVMLLTPLGPRVEYFDLWSFWMPRAAKVVLLAEYLALFALIGLVVFVRRARDRAPGGESVPV